MILLVSGATSTMRELDDPALGYLFVPGSWSLPPDCGRRRWAADNGAFSTFDAGAFLEMLEKLRGRPGALFVAAPDVVGDAGGTLERFRHWQPLIRSLGFPVALVGQNGLEAPAVPWSECEAIFLGGSPECLPCRYVRPREEFERWHCPLCGRRLAEWKLGAAARTIAGYAKARGKWVHMGRVNTKKRLRHAALIGCDSVDGTRFSKWSKKAISLALGWISRHRRQGELEL